MIYHPAADAARAAQASCRFDEAARILEHALQSEPNHPDLVAERAWLWLLSGKEDLALASLESGRGGLRHSELENALFVHYLCRAKLDVLDFRAALARQRFQDLPTPDVGVRITACLITKNEAANLPRCLASLNGIVDEIVVVDTGSTDETVEIAAAAGAVLGRFEWRNDFAAARNAALDLATGDWVLWIDADEELAPECRRAFDRAVVRPYFGGFTMEIVNLVDDRPDGARILHYPMRLFRNHPQIRFTGAIHEQIQPAVSALGLPWGRLEDARIIHHGYRPSVLADGTKLARTRTMLEAAVQQDPRDGFQWFNLANAQYTEGNYPAAETSAAEALRWIEPGAPYRDLTWQLLTSSCTYQGRPEDALDACDRCDADGDGGILNEFERTQALLRLGRSVEALASAERCVALPWEVGRTGDVGIATHKRHVLHAKALYACFDFEAALIPLGIAIEHDPEYASARLMRAAVYDRLGRPEAALADYEVAASDPASAAMANKGMGKALIELGRPEAVAVLESAWHLDPNDPDLWLLWVSACERVGDSAGLVRAYAALASRQELDAESLVDWGRALVQSGDIERALSCFTEAIQRDPSNANAYFNAGDLLYRHGAFTDAAHLYEAGLRFAPTHADAWFTLGNALMQLNLEDGARMAYDQALALRPDHAAAKHNRSLVAA